MKILYLYDGDSSNVNEWSNVPYFVAKALENNGCEVVRYNTHIFGLGAIYDKVITPIIKKIMPSTTFTFQRSRIRSAIMEMKMMYLAHKYPSMDIYFTVSDVFSPGKYNRGKSVILVDWTYEFEIVHDKKKEIDWLERNFNNRQIKIMEQAFNNIVMRAECMDFLTEKYKNINVLNLHELTVNCLYEKNIEKDELICKKFNSKSVVFLGGERYINGAKRLIECIDTYSSELSNIDFYFIGIGSDVIGIDVPSNCHFEGYLFKNNENSRNRYYDLILNSKICINTNDDFVSIASLFEAGYLYTPIIVSKNYQTTSVWGESIQIGVYSSNNVEEICNSIKYIFNLDEDNYYDLCNVCRDAYNGKTWDALMKKWMDSIFGA